MEERPFAGQPDELPDGVEAALSELRSLRAAPKIDDNQAHDPDHVADLLLDHIKALEPVRFITLFTELQVRRLEDHARDICQREYLLLDPHDIAQEAIINVFLGQLVTTRVKPFRVWSRQVIRRVALRAAKDPELATFPPELIVYGNPELISVLASESNRLDFDTRRLVWLAWMERMDLPQLSEHTGVPLERAEWILAAVLERVHRVIKLRRKTNFEDRSDSDGFDEQEGSHDD